ncbi:1-aminocyclopropane-1-carboxylate deaminase/D-cysteine desulfhydrase [Archangium primigenium]|uniref:1-aminocyclopropane-1-carboxylate deaminase/D-cysteine desulfhydrase n=1 Tax=[Archangium] primigenium TaxID=2792470 RepID=UPI0019579752|nr:pyridoxal-phosphate dependent enzyme [Archangium primigenium]MBM7113689.1 pyridoxal-phosphate dependent enzyme [Archangium primigenium]
MTPAFSITPTPVERARWVSESVGREVYVKREGATHALYGGNKARKLATLLADARAREATDLVSVGAAGSHHLLATAVHGRAAGFEVTAVVVPGPDSPEARDSLRATAAQGCRLLPVSGEWAAVPRLLGVLWALKRRGRRPYFLPPGGSSVVGALGYVAAVQELALQHARGELPEWPEAMVCVLGSGGMLAGLAAGVHLVGRPCRVVGVAVWSAWAAHRGALAWMARRTLTRAAGASAPCSLEVERGQLGAGYGQPTEAALEARSLFARDGVALDLTYTAKAAAGLLALARAPSGPRRLLFWHSLSSAPLGPLLEGGPPPSARVRALLR